ncbi:hypothetical protein [Candidatus Odyssella acanthamoebae]|uniref:Uncharacterized protein n=1 Tax=Candidatus Odyssella acanthamoebae TaxID=91604 RepID=A0A077AWU6_9PROT|nr:hypothetical protein [Candidatus Paracaedibacter acanthamoebae]AIK96113.1 hypothetical protein ID47_04195 [Candidatus Paracaedibacter acanthamoebae]
MNFLRSALLIPSLISMAFAGEEEGYFSPAALKIVQHLPTPLRKEALSFQSCWEPLSKELSKNYFGQYINTIINEDGIGKSLRGDEKMPSYKPISFKRKRIQEDDWQDFWSHAEERFQALEEQRNSFGLYFLGAFTFYGYASFHEEEGTQQDPKEQAKNLLNQASEKHYVRATRFMIQEKLWDEQGWNDHPITQPILKTRELEILMPHRIIFQHIRDNETNGSIAWKDINTLKKLLDLLPGEPEQYRQLFSLWAKDLTYRLTLSKQRDSISLPATLLLSSTFASSLVLGANSISNLDKGNSDAEPYNLTIGITQGMASVTGIITGISNAPTVLNWWYGCTFQSLDGQWTRPYKLPLLPSFYSNEEIAKQSSLIALYGILYNKEKLAKIKAVSSSAFKDYKEKLRNLTLSNRENLVKEEILELSVSTQYMEKLRKLILFSYQDNDEALSTVITKKEEEKHLFKL